MTDNLQTLCMIFGCFLILETSGGSFIILSRWVPNQERYIRIGKLICILGITILFVSAIVFWPF